MSKSTKIIQWLDQATRWCSVLVLAIALSPNVMRAEGPSKSPIPNVADQQAALKVFAEGYKEDLAAAKSPEEKTGLARKLLQAGRDPKASPVDRYILYSAARDQAVEAGCVDVAMTAAQAITDSYDSTSPNLPFETITALSKSVRTYSDLCELGDEIERYIAGALPDDRYAQAEEAADRAMAAARRLNDTGMQSQAALVINGVREIHSAYTKARKALEAAQKEPGNASANLAAGQFLCFVKGEWDRGLPMLVLGGNEKFRSLAATEIKVPREPGGEIALGDQWWDLAESSGNLEKRQLLLRAAYWYTKALPDLSELAKPKTEKRLQKIEASTIASSLTLHSPTVNLLGLLDLSRDVVSGQWEFQNGQLVGTPGGNSRVEFPYRPPAEYDLQVSFIRRSGNDALCLICVGQGRQFLWLMGGWGNRIFGFQMINDKFANVNPTTRTVARCLLNGERNVTVIKVRKEGVQAIFNGRVISQYKTDYSDMGLWWEHKLNHGDALGVLAASSFSIDSAELIEISGRGRMIKPQEQN